MRLGELMAFKRAAVASELAQAAFAASMSGAACPAPQEPPGPKEVPVPISPRMLQAGSWAVEEHAEWVDSETLARHVYTAMVRAAAAESQG